MKEMRNSRSCRGLPPFSSDARTHTAAAGSPGRNRTQPGHGLRGYGAPATASHGVAVTVSHGVAVTAGHGVTVTASPGVAVRRDQWERP